MEATRQNYPLISVALCTYNGRRYLDEQIDSLLAQDYPNLEFVIHDDGSDDGTWERLCEIAAQEPRLRCHRNSTRLGSTENFEAALSACRGGLLAPCDQDDRWAPQKLSRLYAAMGSATLIYCDSELMDEQGRLLGERISDYYNMYAGGDPLVFTFLNCISGHALLMRREVFQAALPLPRNFFHDWWLAFVASNLGEVAYLNEPLVAYRQHADAITDVRGRRAKPSGGRARKIARHAGWIATLASYGGPRKNDDIPKLHRLYVNWMSGYLAPSLALFMYRNRHRLNAIKKKGGRGGLSYFWGLKTKRFFVPHRYSDLGGIKIGDL